MAPASVSPSFMASAARFIMLLVLTSLNTAGSAATNPFTRKLVTRQPSTGQAMVFRGTPLATYPMPAWTPQFPYYGDYPPTPYYQLPQHFEGYPQPPYQHEYHGEQENYAAHGAYYPSQTVYQSGQPIFGPPMTQQCVFYPPQYPYYGPNPVPQKPAAFRSEQSNVPGPRSHATRSVPAAQKKQPLEIRASSQVQPEASSNASHSEPLTLVQKPTTAKFVDPSPAHATRSVPADQNKLESEVKTDPALNFVKQTGPAATHYVPSLRGDDRRALRSNKTKLDEAPLKAKDTHKKAAAAVMETKNVEKFVEKAEVVKVAPVNSFWAKIGTSDVKTNNAPLVNQSMMMHVIPFLDLKHYNDRIQTHDPRDIAYAYLIIGERMWVNVLYPIASKMGVTEVITRDMDEFYQLFNALDDVEREPFLKPYRVKFTVAEVAFAVEMYRLRLRIAHPRSFQPQPVARQTRLHALYLCSNFAEPRAGYFIKKEDVENFVKNHEIGILFSILYASKLDFAVMPEDRVGLTNPHQVNLTLAILYLQEYYGHAAFRPFRRDMAHEQATDAIYKATVNHVFGEHPMKNFMLKMKRIRNEDITNAQ